MSITRACNRTNHYEHNLETKKRLGKAMTESVASYECEVCLLKREEQRKLLTLEMDYLVCPDYKKSQTPPLGDKSKQNNQF